MRPTDVGARAPETPAANVQQPGNGSGRPVTCPASVGASAPDVYPYAWGRVSAPIACVLTAGRRRLARLRARPVDVGVQHHPTPNPAHQPPLRSCRCGQWRARARPISLEERHMATTNATNRQAPAADANTKTDIVAAATDRLDGSTGRSPLPGNGTQTPEATADPVGARGTAHSDRAAVVPGGSMGTRVDTCQREGCGKTWARRQGGGRPRKYCSKSCGNAANNSKRKARRRERGPIPCIECGRSFIPSGTQRLCSGECRATRRRRAGREAYSAEPERFTSWQATYRENHHERVKATARRSKSNVRKRDPLRAKAQEADRKGVDRVVRAGRPAELIGADALVGLWHEQKGECLACRICLDVSARQGADGAAELAHLVPIGAGGLHTLSNVGWMDAPCNQAQRDTSGMTAVGRIGVAAVRRGRGVATLHAAMNRGLE